MKIALSNTKDKEQIYLKAQKDYEEYIQNNFTQNILNDKYTHTKGTHTELIDKLHTQNIAKGDSIILKAGGVEVGISSKGLVVKGGEIKAE